MSVEKSQDSTISKASKLAIAITNILPVLGILFWDWKPFDVVFLYWLENIMVGIFVVLRMLVKPNNALLFMLGSLFLAAFFCVHYGFFTYGHGVFILSIFQESQTFSKNADIVSITIDLLHNQYLRIALIGIFLGHLFSYIFDYKERRIDSAGEEMTKPYKRIVIMHLAILFGGFLSVMFQQDFAMALLLVAIKLFFDLKQPKVFKISKQKQATFLNNPNKISPDASDDDIKQFLHQKMAKPMVKINNQEYQFDSVTEMVASPQYQKSIKLLKWVMPKRMLELYHQVIQEQLEAEKEQSDPSKING